ncbi:MAG: ATP-binding protein [Nocardioides sp.]
MPTLTPWSHELELMAHAASVRGARGFVTEVLEEHDLFLLVDDVRLVVSELATNALLHAQTSFTVRLRTALGPAVVLEVRDGSRDGPSVVAGVPLATAGRGIAIVEALCQDWGVDRYKGGGKSVWAVFSTS